jgi:hypothetical protein
VPKGQVRLSVVWDLLDACAPDATRKLGDHFWTIARVFGEGGTRRVKTFGLPTGEKGKANPDIQILQVRKMVRQLEIKWECATGVIPTL